MKIRNKIHNLNKLLKNKLIEAKIYRKKYRFFNLKIEDIEYRLKKALQIIYKYHISSKKIFFIGDFLNNETYIKGFLKYTKHICITKQILLKTILINPKVLLVNNVSLIVIFDKVINNKIINKSFKSKVPIIHVKKNPNIFCIKSSYIILGNFLESYINVKNSLFLILLHTILIKPMQIITNKIKRRAIDKSFKNF